MFRSCCVVLVVLMLQRYVTLSRTRLAEQMLVLQPFAPGLFQQGEMVGPTLLMEYWRESKSIAQVKAAWATANENAEKKKVSLCDLKWECCVCVALRNECNAY